MKIRIITTAKIVYDITVESSDFEDVVKKILSKQYVKLNNNLILLTSSISTIQKL